MLLVFGVLSALLAHAWRWDDHSMDPWIISFGKSNDINWKQLKTGKHVGKCRKVWEHRARRELVNCRGTLRKCPENLGKTSGKILGQRGTYVICGPAGSLNMDAPVMRRTNPNARRSRLDNPGISNWWH